MKILTPQQAYVIAKSLHLTAQKMPVRVCAKGDGVFAFRLKKPPNVVANSLKAYGVVGEIVNFSDRTDLAKFKRIVEGIETHDPKEWEEDSDDLVLVGMKKLFNVVPQLAAFDMPEHTETFGSKLQWPNTAPLRVVFDNAGIRYYLNGATLWCEIECKKKELRRFYAELRIAKQDLRITELEREFQKLKSTLAYLSSGLSSKKPAKKPAKRARS